MTRPILRLHTLYGKRQKNVLISIIQRTTSKQLWSVTYNRKMKQVILLRLLMILCKVMKWEPEGKISVLIFEIIAARSWVLRRQAYCCVLCGNRHLSGFATGDRYRSHAVLYSTFFNTDAARWLRSSKVSVISTVQESRARVVGTGISLVR